MGEGEGKEDRVIVILLQATNDGAISGSLPRRVQRALREKGIDRAATIDVWLDSPGGDAHAAYKLAVLLRARCERLRIVVPEWAKSAATLLSLGGDEIWMSDTAELGPLDAQILDEGGHVVDRMSALDWAQPLEDLATESISIAIATMGNLIATTGMARSELVGPSLQFAAQIVEPLTRQLDPKRIHAHRSLLNVASRYGEELLSRRHADVAECPEDLAQRLVSDFPTHGFVIDRVHARNLGLPIHDLEEYDLEAEVYAVFDRWQAATPPVDVVEVATAQEVQVWVNGETGDDKDVEPIVDLPDVEGSRDGGESTQSGAPATDNGATPSPDLGPQGDPAGAPQGGS